MWLTTLMRSGQGIHPSFMRRQHARGTLHTYICLHLSVGHSFWAHSQPRRESMATTTGKSIPWRLKKQQRHLVTTRSMKDVGQLYRSVNKKNEIGISPLPLAKQNFAMVLGCRKNTGDDSQARHRMNNSSRKAECTTKRQQQAEKKATHTSPEITGHASTMDANHQNGREGIVLL